MNKNMESATVEGFGQEWARFDQSGLAADEARDLFERYFAIFPWKELKADAVGFDMGSGSGRWAKFVSERVGVLHAIDASTEALAVARRNLRDRKNCEFHNVSVESLPFADGSMDFGYSLGVLHHVPDTLEGLKTCVRKLKPGAPFLLYLYYRFDNRPLWFRLIWQLSNALRVLIARLPFFIRARVCDLIALLLYWPLGRLALLFSKMGLPYGNIPLSAYRHLSFYTMRTDALDRFGTKLEQRFTRAEMDEMMRAAGLEQIQFSEQEPFWVALGRRGRS